MCFVNALDSCGSALGVIKNETCREYSKMLWVLEDFKLWISRNYWTRWKEVLGCPYCDMEYPLIDEVKPNF